MKDLFDLKEEKLQNRVESNDRNKLFLKIARENYDKIVTSTSRVEGSRVDVTRLSKQKEDATTELSINKRKKSNASHTESSILLNNLHTNQFIPTVNTRTANEPSVANYNSSDSEDECLEKDDFDDSLDFDATTYFFRIH